MFEKPEAAVDDSRPKALYAVFGHPIAHSKSPTIQRAFAKASHIDMDYRAIDADTDRFADALADFTRHGGRGANITLPLKGAAYAHCAKLTDAARRSGVVNTLIREGDQWRGANTDGRGLITDLAERFDLDLRGRRALVLGAGGAVQAVLPDLLDSGVERVVIANRDPAKADALADRIGQPNHVVTAYWEDIATLGAFDFVLNGTAAGHNGIALRLPGSIAAPRAIAYDMNYGDAAIDFMAWARAAGFAHVHDGLGMLVEQAAESFAMWHGVRPDTDEVYQLLREA